MLLDKFIGSHLTEILTNEELKVSPYGKLNDPFEGLHKVKYYTPSGAVEFVSKWNDYNYSKTGHYLNSEHFDLSTEIGAMNFLEANKNLIIKSGIQAINNCFRIASFANHKSPDTPELAQREVLMWAHYANSQKGARIVFDPSSKKIPGAHEKIDYETEPPELPLELFFSDPKIPKSKDQKAKLICALHTKAKAWKHEDERRLFIELKHVRTRIVKGNKFEYIRFPIKAIKTVDFGIYHDQAERDKLINKLRQTTGSHIRFRQCIRKQNKYEFAYEEV